MLPHEHFLLAFLPILLYTMFRYLWLPTGYTVLLVLLATQLPDLIDKPLAWTLGILPSGRLVAHSLVIVLPMLTVGVLIAATQQRGRQGILFSLSYLSHIAGDFYPILWQGTEFYFFPNLFWPLLPANPDRQPSFVAHIPADFSSVAVPIGILSVAILYISVDIAWRQYAHV